MHVEVRHHAARDELALHEVARQGDAVRALHLARDRELHLARQLGVTALLAALDLVPQRRAVVQPFRRADGEQDFRIDDTGLGREIVHALEALVGQLRRRAVGRRRDRAASGGAGDHLGREVIQRHMGSRHLRRDRECRRRRGSGSNNTAGTGAVDGEPNAPKHEPSHGHRGWLVISAPSGRMSQSDV